MITLQIAGQTPAEVAENVKGFFEQLKVSAGTEPVPETKDAPPTVPEDTLRMPESDQVGAGVGAKQVEQKTESKRGKKAEKQEPAQDAPAPSLQEVRDALLRMAKAKGEDATWELLEKFKAKSASTVAEGDRTKLIAEVEEACR